MADNWTQEQAKTPSAIRQFEIRVFDERTLDENQNPVVTPFIRYSIIILDQNGNRLREVAGDLTNFLTPEQVATAEQFLSNMRAKAELELL